MKFQNKYRVESIRLPGWDYSWNGQYFITICTKKRSCVFGKVLGRKIHFSELGEIANRFWYEIPNHFPFVRLGEFIVMPNHIHGIICIEKPNLYSTRFDTVVETPESGVSTTVVSFPIVNSKNPNNSWKPGSLGVIINQYKRMVTINCRKIFPQFGWQSRYYEHIIRNQESFDRISWYIRTNPDRWVNANPY